MRGIAVYFEIKVTYHPVTCGDCQRGGSRRIPLPLLKLDAICGGGWSTPRTDHINLEKEPRHYLYRRPIGPQDRYERVGTRQNLLLPSKCKRRTVQSVASHYTDYAIKAPKLSANYLTHSEENHIKPQSRYPIP
jgi:hypothetical protein